MKTKNTTAGTRVSRAHKGAEERVAQFLSLRQMQRETIAAAKRMETGKARRPTKRHHIEACLAVTDLDQDISWEDQVLTAEIEDGVVTGSYDEQHRLDVIEQYRMIPRVYEALAASAPAGCVWFVFVESVGPTSMRVTAEAVPLAPYRFHFAGIHAQVDEYLAQSNGA